MPRDTSLDGYLTPYRVGSTCDKVLKGHEPQMCRDWKNLGGSWTECTKLGRLCATRFEVPAK